MPRKKRANIITPVYMKHIVKKWIIPQVFGVKKDYITDNLIEKGR